MNLTDKKKEHKAAGLIALAADKKSGVTSCLTDEELALLVEGKWTEGEKEKGWVHLSDCQECYDQWYSLKMQEEQAGKKGSIVYLMRPKNLALIGSTLAIAASVAVFLNISQDPFPAHLAEEPLPSPQVVKKAETPMPQAVDAEVVTEGVRSRRAAPDMVSEKMATQMNNDQMVPSPELEEKLLGTTYMSVAKMAAAPEKKESIESWLEEVQEGCLTRNNEEKFWSEITRKGEQLFQETAVEDQLQEKEIKVRAILQMVPRRYGADSVTKQCEQILVKLAEGENSR